MNLEFSEEQKMLQKMVRDFANSKVAPFVERMEKGEFPRPLLKEMGSLGLMGIPIPARFGGAAMDFTSYIIALHELSKISATLSVILSVHTSVGTFPILHFGTEKQKETYIPKLARGEYLGAFCLTEPEAGSDASALKTQAVKEGSSYILTGNKIFITNGGEADVYIVFAKTAPTLGKKGITAFIVEKGTPGLTFGKDEKKMGLHGSRTVEVLFDHVRVPEENRLGEEGEGYKIALSGLDGGRIGIAAQALGIAERALEKATEYAKMRKQFGRPIIENQGIAFKLADMATMVEASKLLVYRAADLKSKGLNCGMESSMAKLFASQTARKVAIEAVQIFGGYGYSKEYEVERLFRDAKITEIYEGTSEIQRIVIGKHLID